MRLDLYRLKLDRLRKLENPTDEDRDDIAYLSAQIATIRAQLESLDKP